VSTITQAITRRAVCSPGGANQPKDVHNPISGPKLHRGVEQILVSIGDEEVLGTLGAGGIDAIGPLLELEALGTTDGEGGEGQNKCLNREVHEVEGESKVGHAGRLVLGDHYDHGRVASAKSVLCGQPMAV
jgi:hypothetical protein